MADDDTKNKRRARGGGGLHLDSRGLWRGTVWVVDTNGKRKQKVVSSKNKAIASGKLNQLRSDVLAGKAKLVSRWAAAFMTGARQAELLGLEWDRVDLENGTMDISWQLQRLSYVHGCELEDDKPSCGRQRVGYCPDKKLDLPPAFEKRHCHRSLFWTRPVGGHAEEL